MGAMRMTFIPRVTQHRMSKTACWVTRGMDEALNRKAMPSDRRAGPP